MDKKDFIFGVRSVIEAIDAGKTINKILIQKGTDNNLIQELNQKLKPLRKIVQYVPAQKLDRVTRKNHQGVIAFVSPVEYSELEMLLPGIYESGETPLVLLLDRITDVRNFGAIARTAECMGVHAIIIPAKGGALINADAVKTSAGALNRMPVCRERFLDNTIHYLKESGFQIIGCSEKGDKAIDKISYDLPTAVIMGSEEDGISSKYMDLCDALVYIPMQGSTASLNVSVATGMCLYEINRQR